MSEGSNQVSRPIPRYVALCDGDLHVVAVSERMWPFMNKCLLRQRVIADARRRDRRRLSVRCRTLLGTSKDEEHLSGLLRCESLDILFF